MNLECDNLRKQAEGMIIFHAFLDVRSKLANYRDLIEIFREHDLS